MVIRQKTLAACRLLLVGEQFYDTSTHSLAEIHVISRIYKGTSKALNDSMLPLCECVALLVCQSWCVFITRQDNRRWRCIRVFTPRKIEINVKNVRSTTMKTWPELNFHSNIHAQNKVRIKSEAPVFWLGDSVRESKCDKSKVEYATGASPMQCMQHSSNARLAVPLVLIDDYLVWTGLFA